MKWQSKEEDVAVNVEKFLNKDQKESFLATAFKVHPMLRGAHVADILDLLYSHDRYIAEVEQAHRNFPDGRNVSYAVYLTKYIPDLDIHEALEIVASA